MLTRYQKYPLSFAVEKLPGRGWEHLLTPGNFYPRGASGRRISRGPGQAAESPGRSGLNYQAGGGSGLRQGSQARLDLAAPLCDPTEDPCFSIPRLCLPEYQLRLQSGFSRLEAGHVFRLCCFLEDVVSPSPAGRGGVKAATQRGRPGVDGRGTNTMPPLPREQKPSGPDERQG